MSGLGDASMEILIDGKPIDPFAAPICPHEQFHHDTKVGLARNDAGRIIARQVQVRLVCAGCGLPVEFATAEDGRIGALSPDRRTLSAVIDL